MTEPEQPHAHREQPWREEDLRRGRVVVLSDNPISAALAAIGEAVGHQVTVISDDDGGPGLSRIVLESGDAVVLCDHDAPDAPAVLRAALRSDASYVAMMASRRRAAGLLGDLEAGARARSPCRSWLRSWPRPTAAPAAQCRTPDNDDVTARLTAADPVRLRSWISRDTGC